MLDAAVWLLLALLLMALIFAILGMLVGLLCALVTTSTKLFSYAGTDLWEGLENYCERANRPHLLTLISLVAKFQTPDSERASQLDYLHKKKALMAEASALVQRHARLAEQTDEARQTPKDSGPRSTHDQSMHQNQLMQKSHTVSVEIRKNWQKIQALSDEYPVTGAWIRADLRMSKKLEPHGKEAQACRLRGGCCRFADCDCCGNPRAWKGGVSKDWPEIYMYAHCTRECSCCQRRERCLFGGDDNGSDLSRKGELIESP
ncbi:hypothetical protein BP00DRAFT_423127 [Aspergillus indologenus CBS 114.80]|uniref:Uncharacterized protein n=1 Tax=Aspergillus indologenus CBS 114.80 TaxID=1450541 RepID=A0A2V5J8E8_9EURO|nr:hypothetical protein BP00DRAFT_423127 [Aspergillus indologenus CBS 114.80]